jgi:hypothetical protein
VVIKTERSDKTEIKKFFLKISGHQQRWPRPLPGAILIPPALLVVADFEANFKIYQSGNRNPAYLTIQYTNIQSIETKRNLISE